eukprot:441452-Pyramimonas_sp.AAC.1
MNILETIVGRDGKLWLHGRPLWTVSGRRYMFRPTDCNSPHLPPFQTTVPNSDGYGSVTHRMLQMPLS